MDLSDACLKAGIDKLEAHFLVPIEMELLLRKAKDLGHQVNFRSLRDRKRYLEIKNNNYEIFFRIGIDSKHVTCFLSNPNKFQTWEIFWDFLTTLVPNEVLISTQISRLDLNLDFECDLQSLMKAIDVRGKQLSQSYLSKAGKKTGVYIGKGPGAFVFYDKSSEGMHISRIEIRLSKHKLPTRSLMNLKEKVLGQVYFHELLGQEIRLNKTYKKLELEKKLETFFTILERDGFYAAKKELNTSRNFHRDYQSFFKATPWKRSPSEIFATQIQTFMKGKA